MAPTKSVSDRLCSPDRDDVLKVLVDQLSSVSVRPKPFEAHAASNELFGVPVPSPEQKDWMLCSCRRKLSMTTILHRRIISYHLPRS